MTPGRCPHETSQLDGKKSNCSLMKSWTNCREAGVCLWEAWKSERESVNEPHGQLALEL